MQRDAVSEVSGNGGCQLQAQGKPEKPGCRKSVICRHEQVLVVQ
jgi:hypothetical protein